jgi:glyoxylase-like metal-dependent hydrolase (beta-lactamase superfamily II)
MNGIFNAEFTFHNVGQGLFYTGEISSNKSIFRFVYDCGQDNSNKNVCSAVDAFHSRVMDGDIGNEKPLINLLIISHFHYDHVSGCFLQEKIPHFRKDFSPGTGGEFFCVRPAWAITRR